MSDRGCLWLIYGTPRRVQEAFDKRDAGDPAYEDYEWYPDSPGDFVSECGAEVTYTDHGWTCTAGHSHDDRLEYYDNDEVEMRRLQGIPFPDNAVRIDGSHID